jgi:hypothetical protein
MRQEYDNGTISCLGELHSKPRPWPLAWAALAAAAAAASKQAKSKQQAAAQARNAVVIITCDDHMPQIRTSAVNNTQNQFEKKTAALSQGVAAAPVWPQAKHETSSRCQQQQPVK